jgi:MFS family permease
MAVARALRAAALDVRPLRESRDFRLLWSGQLVSMLGRQITVVAIPYQVFSLSRSTLAVGLLGAAQVVPLVGASFFGGVLADRLDRRRLLLATNAALAACSAVLAVAALRGDPPAWFVVAMAACIAGFAAVDQPARAATIPSLVPRALLPAAMALNFALFSIGMIIGPAVGGLIIGGVGLGAAYLVDVATFGVAIAAVVLMSAQPPRGAVVESPLRAIATGLRHLRRQRVILGTYAADLDAMIFGMPRALFPVLAVQTFHTGASGLGLLYAAPAAGALATVMTTGWLRRAHRLGRIVVLAVTAWGAAITLAGLFGVFWAALLLLAVAGGADAVSAVCRSTIVQSTTPDHIRGRVASASSMVVVGGPYVGDLEAGAVGAAFTPQVSFVSGGLLCLAGIGAVALAFPELWAFDSTHDALPDVPAASAPFAAPQG